MNKQHKKHIVRAPLQLNISQGALRERLRFAHLADDELATITGGGASRGTVVERCSEPACF
jgi:hypothetical protein